ncbi:MAG: hypothetical protein PHE33_06500 [Bacteroidales bacterium]|nr:hypothetical protein [Bacteroidales bacterium]
MKKYRMNKNTLNNPNGNNEVHEETCHYFNTMNSFEELGYHANCQSAVLEAKRKGYPKADGCKICSLACHRG